MKPALTIPPDLQAKIVRLGVLRSQIFRTAAEFRRLSTEVKATLAASFEVQQ